MHSDKAQLSSFIIIGLLALIGLLLIQFYLSSGGIQPGLVYPREAQPVASYIEDCAKISGAEGISIMGNQGGWIQIPDWIDREVGASLHLDEQGIRKIPYWEYQGESRIPTLSGMERQLSDHITENIRGCLGKLDTFPGTKVTPIGNLSTSVVMADEDVVIQIYYPLRITTGSQEVIVDSFQASVPARMKRLRDLAESIMLYESDQLFFENLTIDLMNANSNIPFTNLQFKCGKDIWTNKKIQTELEATLKGDLQNIRVANTDHTPFAEDIQTYESLRDNYEGIISDLDNGLEDIEESRYFPKNTPPDAFEYFHEYINIPSPLPKAKTAFQYNPEYGMYLRANPSRQGVMQSSLMLGDPKFLPFLCINAYHFTYDVRYPIRASILDPESFDGKGLILDYAFLVQLQNNEPSREHYSYTLREELRPAPEGFCEKYGDKMYEFRAVGLDADGYPSTEGIDSVNISYRCAGRQCNIGTTGALQGRYALQTRIPAGCKNAYIIAAKPGYLKGEARLSGEGIDIPITKLIDLGVDVKKHAYFAQIDKTIRDEAEDLDQETAVIHVSAQNGKLDEVVGFRPNETSMIQLVEGTANYDIEIILSRGDTIIGGYKASNLTIKGDEIGGARQVTFHTFEYRPIPINSNESANLAAYMLSEEYSQRLKPELR